jgi:hypothetical protein
MRAWNPWKSMEAHDCKYQWRWRWRVKTRGWVFFVCFNHSVFTLLRVWQPLTPLRLRAGRLDGGAPLLLPVVPFWQKESIWKCSINYKGNVMKSGRARRFLLFCPLPAGSYSYSSARLGGNFPISVSWMSLRLWVRSLWVNSAISVSATSFQII